MSTASAGERLDAVRRAGRIDAALRLGRRLAGGRNNDVFEVLGGDEALCLKVYPPRRRDGFVREGAVLDALRDVLPGRVPRLVAAEPAASAILMSRVPGAPLVAGAVTEAVVAAIVDVLGSLYAIDVNELRIPEVRWSPRAMFDRVEALIRDAAGSEASSEWRE